MAERTPSPPPRHCDVRSPWHEPAPCRPAPSRWAAPDPLSGDPGAGAAAPVRAPPAHHLVTPRRGRRHDRQRQDPGSSLVLVEEALRSGVQTVLIVGGRRATCPACSSHVPGALRRPSSSRGSTPPRPRATAARTADVAEGSRGAVARRPRLASGARGGRRRRAPRPHGLAPARRRAPRRASRSTCCRRSGPLAALGRGRGPRGALGLAVALLGFVGRDPDPARSREHVLLAHLAERRLRARGGPRGSRSCSPILADRVAAVGVLGVGEFFAPKSAGARARAQHPARLSRVRRVAQGAPLDVAGGSLRRPDAAAAMPRPRRSSSASRTSATTSGSSCSGCCSISCSRGCAASPARATCAPSWSSTRSSSFCPRTRRTAPAKRPLLVPEAGARVRGRRRPRPQNPMDLDYKALSNAGAWFVGRLQTDADRERVVEALGGEMGAPAASRPRPLGHAEGAPRARSSFATSTCSRRRSSPRRASACVAARPVTRREVGPARPEHLPAPPAPVGPVVRARHAARIRRRITRPPDGGAAPRCSGPDRVPLPSDRRRAPLSVRRARPSARSPGGTVVLDPAARPLHLATRAAKRSCRRRSALAGAATPAATAPPPLARWMRSLYAHAPRRARRASAPSPGWLSPWSPTCATRSSASPSTGASSSPPPLLPDGKPDLVASPGERVAARRRPPRAPLRRAAPHREARRRAGRGAAPGARHARPRPP